MTEDRELLREYIERHSEQAFAELVARHVNLVYSTALRVVGECQLAQDVAQATFISLACKAASIRDGDALGGWLYRAAYNAGASALRAEQRRREREAEAVNRAELNADTHGAWEAIGPLLEVAMRQLKPAEQDALVLRYFEGKSLREAGQTLAITEDAVQKRVSRALDKLRTHFARKGVVVSAAVLAGALSTHAVQAGPTGLAASLASASLAGAGSAAASAPASILKFLVMTKVQAVTLGLLFVAGVATPLTLSHSGYWRRPGAFASGSLAAGATEPGPFTAGLGAATSTNAPADSPAMIRLRNWLERADHSRLLTLREDELRRLVRALAPGEFPRAWALRGGLKSALFRATFGHIVLECWAVKDWPAALAVALAVPDKQERKDFLDSAVCAWATKSPLEAAAWIKSFYPVTEQLPKLRLVFAQCGAQNPQAARSLWQQTPPGIFRDSLVTSFIDALAEQDMAAAAACLNDIRSSRVRKTARNSILEQWAGKDAAAALAWVQNQPRLQERDEAIGVVASGMSQQDPAEAAEMLKALSPLALEHHLGQVGSLIGNWAGDDLPAATAWAKQLPEGPLREQAFESVLTQWAEQDPQGAVAFAQALPESTTQSKLLSQVARDWANRDAKAALSWLEAVPDGPLRSTAVMGFTDGLAMQRPEQAARFVAGLPPGELQSGAALKVVITWAEDDPQSAADWAAAFPAGQTREQALTEVARQWLQWDRPAAEAWLQKTALPADTKAKLLHK